MAKAAPQQQQIQPGQLFRLPGIGARPCRVEEPGPIAFGGAITLNGATSTGAGFGKFSTLDIDAAFLFENVYTTTYTQGTGTFTQSPLFPANNITSIQVQFESAYSTFRLPGWLAQVFQQFRSSFGPANRLSALAQSGANPYPANSLNANPGWFPSTANAPLGTTPNLAANVTGTPQTYAVYYEIPVSFYFDLYYELSATGAPIGMPIPRAIVSPQRMAASTRNVIPKVTYAPGFATNDNYDSPVSVGAVPGTAAYVGSVVSNWWRQAWIPTDDMATEPPGRMWQYTRDYITFQPNQAAQVPIPLDDEIPGQGQILAIVFACWDPALAVVGGVGQGAFTPYSAYTTVELKYGSSVQIYQDTPGSNQYAWLMQHGSILPQGVMGWDLALTMDGKMTNENALNTLVQAGCQLVINFATGSKPSAASTIYVGLEVLKKVGS